jgi:hypothetical protein
LHNKLTKYIMKAYGMTPKLRYNYRDWVPKNREGLVNWWEDLTYPKSKKHARQEAKKEIQKELLVGVNSF